MLSIILILGVFLTSCNKEKVTHIDSEESLEHAINKEQIIQYLQKNNSAIDLEDESEFADLAIMDSDIKGKKIFFTGEVHGIKANEELNMKFLKYFKEKTNFKYYLCETAYSDAYFINKYLETGDIKILEEIYKPLKGTFAWNKDSYNHWKKLYEYNKTLPKKKRIQVIGVDIEHQPANAYRFLVDVLPEKEVPKEIKESIDKIKDTFNNLDKIGYEAILKCSKELQKDIEEKEDIYKEYIGQKFTGFKLVNMNVLNVEEAYSTRDSSYEDWNNTRDKMIYENFKVIQKELPKGKYYGQWGSNHVYQSKEKDIMWFASYLNAEGSEFKDSILTIIYDYDDCEQMDKLGNGNYTTNRVNYINPKIKEANDSLGGNLNIYKLTGENSPFSKVSMSYTFTGEELDESMLDFFQYIVCIKNSKATEPLNDEYD